MTPEALTEHGFREYAPNHQMDERFEKAWCYAERVSAGRLYFVHVRFWRHSQYSTPDNEVPDGWDAWAQFTDTFGNTFNVSLLRVDHLRPAQVVEWFGEVWYRLRCQPYDREEEQEQE